MGCNSTKSSLEIKLHRLWTMQSIRKIQTSTIISIVKSKPTKSEVIKSIASLFETDSKNPFDLMILEKLKKSENNSYHYFCIMFVILVQSQGLIEDPKTINNSIFDFLKLTSPSTRNTSQVNKDGKAFVNIYDFYMLVCYYINFITLESIKYIEPNLDSQDLDSFLDLYTQLFSYENQNKLIDQLFFEFIHLSGLDAEVSLNIFENIRNFCRFIPEDQVDKSLEKFSSEGSSATKSKSSRSSKFLIREVIGDQVCWISLDYAITNVLAELTYSKVRLFLLAELKRNITYK